MDMDEDLLFQHISIVLKLLNSFTDKNNITTPHILRRLDYLYERLSDFLGRDLENGWWSDNSQIESQLTYFKSPQNLIARTQTSSSREESIDFQSPQSFETAESRLIPSNFDSVGTTDPFSMGVVNFCLSQNNITESTSSTPNIETRAAQHEVQKNDIISSECAQSSCMKAINNCELVQDVTITETETYAESVNVEPLGNTGITENVSPTESTVWGMDESTDIGCKCMECNGEITLPSCDQAFSLALHVRSTMHQQAMKQKTEKSAVKITAKRYVTVKARKDLGKNMVERITTTYLCEACNVNILDSVRSHVLERNHKENMREKYGVECTGTETTEAICEKNIITYHCGLCSVDTSSVKNLEAHIAGQRHITKMLEGISDKNIRITSKGTFFCKLCFIKLSSQQNVFDHLQGRFHKKKLAQEKEVGPSLQSVCERQKDVDVESQFITYSNIAMVCKVCNVYVLKVHLKEHISSKQHLERLVVA